MGSLAIRGDRRGVAQSMSAVEEPTLRVRQTGGGGEEEGEKDELAGPSLPPVRGVAATSAAQDKDNCSGR